MQKVLELQLPPHVGLSETALDQYLHAKFDLKADKNFHYRLQKRSIDARRHPIRVNLRLHTYHNEPLPPLIKTPYTYPHVNSRPPILVIGCGPAGMFAALRLVQLGFKPIVLDRGKDVRSRRRDLADINKKHLVNPDSNYCFGEGGAGTYSDGKLYTRSKKRGNIRRILEILVQHGATEKILYESHPHIGTNKLPQIVQALRESILAAGGEVHFNTRVTGFRTQNQAMQGVETAEGQIFEAQAVILATGHSARDIYRLLHQANIQIEFKPFALGVRVEHPQSLIDKIQYRMQDRGEFLPASAYSLVTQADWKGQKRGVFSFCMCPGGFIVPAATAPGEIVVNGMSPSRRNSRFANSGIVTSLEWEDLKAFHQHGPLAGLAFQEFVEQKAGQEGQTAPAQRLLDYCQKKVSPQLNDCSYQPGLKSVDFRQILPSFIAHRLQEGFRDFGRKMKGYLSNEAQMVGIESRTSAPVRIPRDPQSLEHPEISGLFPCGEGAGYAGGIMSAAMDGERVAEALALKFQTK